MTAPLHPAIPGAEALAERWRTPDDPASPLRVDELPSFHLTRLAVQMRRHVTQEILAGSELSYAEWRVLSMLTELGPISTPEMVRISSMDKGQLSRAAEQLLRRGLVTQQPDAANARRKILDATPVGRELNQQALAASRRWQVQLLLELPEDERVVLARALRRLEAAVSPEAASPAEGAAADAVDAASSSDAASTPDAAGRPG